MIDIDEALTRGGAQRLGLLRYCVISITMEPLFLFLASEYRLRPSHNGALTLFDSFCAINAPARLTAYELLPPRELGVAAEIARIRERCRALQTPAEQSEDEVRSVAPAPSRTLFDALVRGIRSDARGTLAALGAAYDPQLTAQENLPGGKMSASQRQFVDRVWQPLVRPRLVSAGFWQVGSIG